MKVVIRQGLFETNSSSVHSLQIAKSNEDSMELLFEAMNAEIHKWQDEDDAKCIKDGKLILTGIPGADGSDDESAYAIISKWMPKVQYLYAYLAEQLTYLDEADTFEAKDINDDLLVFLNMDYSDRTTSQLSKLWPMQELVKMICETSSYTPDQIVFEKPVENYDRNEDGDDLFSYKELTNRDLFVKKLWYLFDNVIVSGCMAYSSCDGTTIYFY